MNVVNNELEMKISFPFGHIGIWAVVASAAFAVRTVVAEKTIASSAQSAATSFLV